MGSVAIAVAVFVLVYLVITLELMNKAVAALLGVAVLIMAGVVEDHHAFPLVDF